MYVSVGDIRLFVDVDGAKLVPDGAAMRERSTIVLVHGSGGDHTPFKEEFRLLREDVQVVYYDQRGHGRSEKGAPERWTLDQWADDLRFLCDALGIESPVVFGASFGGVVALNYAARHPDHPGKLIIASTAARVDAEPSIAMYARLGGEEVAAVARRFYAAPAEHREEYRRVCGPYATQSPPQPEVAARVTPESDVTLHFLQSEFLTFDLTPALSRIRCPVLLLAGELDPIVPMEATEGLAAALPPELVRVERIANAGHVLRADEPETVIGLVREFVLDEAENVDRGAGGSS